jgi:hypothetical protein
MRIADLKRGDFFFNPHSAFRNLKMFLVYCAAAIGFRHQRASQEKDAEQDVYGVIGSSKFQRARNELPEASIFHRHASYSGRARGTHDEADYAKQQVNGSESQSKATRTTERSGEAEVEGDDP